MTDNMKGPDGCNPPEPNFARNVENEHAANIPPEWCWEGPGGPIRLDTALAAKRIKVDAVAGDLAFVVRGSTAKALLALIARGPRGISPPEALHFAAQLGSPICDLRRWLGDTGIHLVRLPNESNRYRLARPVLLEKVTVQ